MSRASTALLLLLAAASGGAAQAPGTAAWTLDLGDYTIYGHTTYNPRLLVVPRRVFDTVRKGVEHERRRAAASRDDPHRTGRVRARVLPDEQDPLAVG